MGIDKDKWVPSAKDQFVKKAFDNFANEFNKKHNLDLRNAHFGLGNQGLHYTSLQVDSFKNPKQLAQLG